MREVSCEVSQETGAHLHRPQTNGFFPSGVGVPHSKQTDSSNCATHKVRVRGLVGSG